MKIWICGFRIPYEGGRIDLITRDSKKAEEYIEKGVPSDDDVDDYYRDERFAVEVELDTFIEDGLWI